MPTYRLRALCFAVVLAAGGLGGSCIHAGAVAASGPAPPPIDLDRFDSMKKTLVLPDGESLAFIDMGAPKGPPVVLIHGYTDSARDWVPLLPYLSPQLRLILIDIRGHGRSGKPECCYARLDFAYDVKLLLDALGVARADLVGHSLGGYTVHSNQGCGFVHFFAARDAVQVAEPVADDLEPHEFVFLPREGVLSAVRDGGFLSMGHVCMATLALALPNG